MLQHDYPFTDVVAAVGSGVVVGLSTKGCESVDSKLNHCYGKPQLIIRVDTVKWSYLCKY